MKNKLSVTSLLCAGLLPTALYAAGGESRFSDEEIPYVDVEDMPDLTPPLFELGDVFLRPGNIKPGFELPTGAVWQPRFWVFGTLRSSLHSFRREGVPCPLGSGTIEERCTEWSNRLDLFGNLQLTGTERLLVGIQPLHERGRFTGVTIQPDNDATDTDFRDETNADVTTLFFEGDFGEIFPGLDPTDTGRFDWGFSVGRQPLSFQDGLLLNDTQDALGLTRNNLRISGWDWLNNLRLTFLYGWNRVGNEAVQPNDQEDQLLGLFTAWDTVFGNSFASTLEMDVAYLISDDAVNGDLVSAGFAAIQRIGHVGSSLRLLVSQGDDASTVVDRDGFLGFLEMSVTPYGTHNVLYGNAFVSIDNYTSIARGPDSGGPLGRVGLLFAARGIGAYPAPLSNQAGEAAGGAVGYQMFFDETRRQLIVETGVRAQENTATGDREPSAAFGLRLRQAVGRRMIVDLEGFVSATRVNDESSTGSGARLELLWKL